MDYEVRIEDGSAGECWSNRAATGTVSLSILADAERGVRVKLVDLDLAGRRRSLTSDAPRLLVVVRAGGRSCSAR